MRALLSSLESSESTRAWGITVLRVVVGFAFFMHGWQKVFEFGVPGIQTGFEQMGIPLAALTAPLVAYLELFGGAALMLGLFTRWIAIPLAFSMLVAMTLVHWSGGFFMPSGIELTLLLFAGLATLALGGPGALAVDHILAQPTRGWAPQPSIRAPVPPRAPSVPSRGIGTGQPPEPCGKSDDLPFPLQP